ncbi:MAG: hypothetical protein KC646_18220 [Candidatus Cloacimonetes bacterium]|nr:hypothetical protein [Candidatus Cloacimonadota bacterium]
MKQESTSTMIIKSIMGIAMVIFLGILILQINNLEKNLILVKVESESTKLQLNKLNNTLNKINKVIKSGSFGVSSNQQVLSERKWLHPEVKNFLMGDPPKPAPEDAPSKGVFDKVYSFQGVDPKGFNFVIENGADVSEEIQEYLTMYLGRRSPNDPAVFYGDLAERIEITDDYKEYTIYIKEGVKWHRPLLDWSNPRYQWIKDEYFVTAHDVKYTYDLIMNSQVQASHSRNYYKDIESVKVLDNHTLVIRWKKKTYQSVSTTMGLYPTPKWLYAYNEDGEPFPEETAGLKFNEHWYNSKAIGCGAYQFVKWDKGVLIQLRRNDDYIGAMPPIKQINYHLIRDKNQQLLNFQSGLLDIHNLPVAQYRDKILDGPANSPYKNGTYKVEPVTRMVYRYIGWNLELPMFKDKKVRQALTHAMDRKNVIKKQLNGLGTLITGNFYRHSTAYDESIEPWEFDLSKSKKLLDEAGWIDTDGDGILDKIINGVKTDFKFGILTYGYREEIKSWVSIYKENLYKLGIQMEMQPTEWSVMLKRMEDREFDSYTGGWGLDFDGDPYQIWHSSQADLSKSSNRIGFRNKEADVIIDKLRETFEPEERVKLQRAFHKIVHEEQPYLFMYNEKLVVVTHPRLKNVSFQKARPHVQTMNWYLEE